MKAEELDALIKCFFLLNRFFNDETKVDQWMLTDNPLLGDVAPVDMVARGRTQKLLKFIEYQLAENPQADCHLK